MNRLLAVNLVLVGLLIGVVAGWAGSPSVGHTASPGEGPCERWSTQLFEIGERLEPVGRTVGIPPGWEPVTHSQIWRGRGMAAAGKHVVLLRRCEDTYRAAKEAEWRAKQKELEARREKVMAEARARQAKEYAAIGEEVKLGSIDAIEHASKAFSLWSGEMVQVTTKNGSKVVGRVTLFRNTKLTLTKADGSKWQGDILELRSCRLMRAIK